MASFYLVKTNQMNQQQKTNLFDLDKSQLSSFIEEMGERPFRVTQIMKWLYHRSVIDFDLMTDISKKSRDKLKEIAEVTQPKLETERVSRDGTIKWLLRLCDGNAVEVVYIPTDDRGTLCVSTQAGCSLGCSFCATAKQGFNRNLTASEIISQLWIARENLRNYFTKKNLTNDLEDYKEPITNVVLMGMGEPLLNFNNTISATNIMMDDLAFKLSKRRVTISTAGIVPAIKRLSDYTDVSLAVSLHAPNNELRDKLIPVNKKYPLEELIPACKGYISDKSHRTITWEYILIDGINDSEKEARELIRLIKGVPSKINLIPFNPFEGCSYKRSREKNIGRFSEIIHKAGLTVTVRKSRGDDIEAACGQLVGNLKNNN